MRLTHNAERHHRRALRLKGYDCTLPGAYFVTICTQNRECLLGEIVDGEMHPNEAGRMVQAIWNELPNHYTGVQVDAFVVMPNHIHGIIVLSPMNLSVEAGPCACPDPGHPQGVAPTLSLPDVVHRFKSLTTARYRHGVARGGWPAFDRRLWQRNYYEHVIRNERDMDRIREYILNNPLRWAEDENNPALIALKESMPR